MKGKLKKNVGKAADDPGLEAEGRVEESKGDVKQAGREGQGRLQEVIK